jgi:hypothetical protein
MLKPPRDLGPHATAGRVNAVPLTRLVAWHESRITRLLDTHPYSAQQILQRLREEGYDGGITILRDYVRRIRPPKRPVYLKLHFSPGECAQVDIRPRSGCPARPPERVEVVTAQLTPLALFASASSEKERAVAFIAVQHGLVTFTA